MIVDRRDATIKSREALVVNGLNVSYRYKGSDVHAVRDVSLSVREGEIVGVVGESGSGKSTLASAILNLLPMNGRVESGEIHLLGSRLSTMKSEELRRLRGAGVGAVFQDPSTTFCPTLTLGAQFRDAMAAHSLVDSRTRFTEMAEEAVRAVGLPDASHQLRRYPHELSGGMRQRMMIALALLLKPSLLVMDEPTSALDVTLQAQILKLILDLRQTLNAAIVLISHDLGVVARTCDRVAVMYGGQIVESNGIDSIFRDPAHPYTRALLAAVPTNRFTDEAEVVGIPGSPPDLSSDITGCSFSPRCPVAGSLCDVMYPTELSRGERGTVRCHAMDPSADYSPSTPAPNRVEVRAEDRTQE